MKVKVCGMRDDANIKELLELAPDYIGFIFYASSPRFVGKNFNKEIALSIPTSTKRVGVFVNELIEQIYFAINKYKLDVIQLHGGESPEYCFELKLLNVKIIKAFSISEEFDFRSLDPYKKYCDYFLFDTKGKEFGGTGKKFNWKILQKYNNEKPILISGGIGPEDANDIKALHGLNIHAVDINSCFETEPGMKNIGDIRKFISNIRY